MFKYIDFNLKILRLLGLLVPKVVASDLLLYLRE